MEEIKPEEKPQSERPEWLIKPLRTLRGDIEEVVKEGRTSAVKIAVAETQRATGAVETVSNFTAPRREWPWKNILIGAAGAILIAAAGVGLYFIYKKVSAPEPTVISVKRQTIINTETEKTLDISNFARPKIIAMLNAEKIFLPKNLSTVVGLNFVRKTGSFGSESSTTTEAVASGDFLEQLQVQANTPFVRALAPDFVFGFHILGQPEPFLILKASAYDFAYAGMLRWENYFAADLGSIFLSTTTPSNLFEDKIIYNKDARVLRGADGAIRLLYSFNDKNTIIITTNEITFKNLVDRLRAAKLIR
ncbi:MAG: hypothetical protein CEO19_282 [Parcubacteria group bacterium Gr01-1014_73]|nr:MAG: hypothetical protein CEO19_282 [Parcubacteria group bacterium Gr01-1014_73]